jgi:Mn-containing catalase
MLCELLVDELQDLLHAEGQLLKALPKMAKAAHAPKLKAAFEAHRKETEDQVERLSKPSSCLMPKSKPNRAKPCSGWSRRETRQSLREKRMTKISLTSR